MVPEMFAWMHFHDGRWNTIGAGVPGIGNIPLVASSVDVAMAMQSFAEEFQKKNSEPVSLFRFATPEVVMTYCPEHAAAAVRPN